MSSTGSNVCYDRVVGADPNHSAGDCQLEVFEGLGHHNELQHVYVAGTVSRVPQACYLVWGQYSPYQTMRRRYRQLWAGMSESASPHYV